MTYEWRHAYDTLHEALKLAQQQRPRLRADLAWIVYERDVMHETTNRLRVRAGRLPVSENEIRRVESMACGHVDYTSKFALYCADLVTSHATPSHNESPETGAREDIQ